MFKHYINGKLVEGKSERISVFNPATEETAGTLFGADVKQGLGALDAAQKAFSGWSSLSLNQREEWILKLAHAIELKKENVLDLLMSETGKPFDNAVYDFNMLIDCLKYYIDEAKRLHGTIISDYDNKFRNLVIRQPLGVVLGYLAWNFPLLNLGYKLGPILASGCTCVLKPSGKTPLATLYIGEIAEKLGFPAGVINIIAGSGCELAEVLSGSTIPKMITLIGSTETGKNIIRQSATSIKRFSLELGGNAPAIVMKDADIEDAAKKLVDIKFTNSGQVCVSPNRVFVHESIHDEFVDAVKKYTLNITFGWGREAGAIMGPLISKEDRARIHEFVNDAVRGGARIVCGGGIPPDKVKGCFYLPTVLENVTSDMKVYRNEIFGPIMPIIKFTDKAEVIDKANDTEYGLASYLFTQNINDAFDISEAIEYGTVCINEPFYAYNLPHGGTKESGIGKDCSFYSLEEYYYLKRISIKR